jgi:hypothetical protein
VEFKTVAGTGIAMTNTDNVILYCDGVNVVNAQTSSLPTANLSGGAAGQLVYQVGGSSTGFSAAGTSGQVAISGGTGAPTWSNLSIITNAATGKTTPVDADSLPLYDSAATTTATKVTWANVKATLATYFGTWLQFQTATFFTTAGTSTAFTLAVTPTITSNSAGQRFRVKFNAAAGATPTLTVGTGATVALKYFDGAGTATAVTSAQIPINWQSDVEYNATEVCWVLVDRADIQAYDADTLKADTADTLTAGFAATPYNAGTKSSGTFTPDEANGNFQYCVNGGAFTLAPPTNNCTLIIQVTNNASAGTITTSGFTKVTGTAPGTTDAEDFLAYVTKINGFSHLAWQALQ